MVETVLITGASRGIGLAAARLMADLGWSVIGIASNAPDQAFPGRFYAADLGDISESTTVLSEIVSAHEIHGVVNSVGLNLPEPLGDVDLANLLRVFDLNVRTAVQTTQAVLPGMLSRKYGRIVNISSRGALGRPLRTSYGAAKAGIIGMTRTWALELAREGITANVVSPGPTATEMFVANNLDVPEGEANRELFLADVPLGRFGLPEEIAYAISFFLDRRASFVTGQVLHVCGGSSVGRAAI